MKIMFRDVLVDVMEQPNQWRKRSDELHGPTDYIIL
jgi:hypothetical protein